MRERQILDEAALDALGITPAYAGKTINTMLGLVNNKDHPRVCGKDKMNCVFCPSFAGSPPRMRERLTSSLAEAVGTGITPAYAGKTVVVKCFQKVF